MHFGEISRLKMARLEEKYRLDDPAIRLLLPGWELFSATGKKLHNWLRSHKDIANNLWRMQLLKIAQQSHHPHCPTCTCGNSPQPPMRLLDLDDIQALRVIKLNPILTQDDAMIRDSYNAPISGPAEPRNPMPSEVGPINLISSSTEEAAEVSSSPQPERVVRYRSPTPVAQAPKLVTAASQCSPPISRKEDNKKKKSKKQKRCKSITPDSFSGPSRAKARNNTWPKHRSRSPPHLNLGALPQ